MKKMKFLFTAIIVGVVSTVGFAQWAPTTDTTVDIARDGNVSIGNTSLVFSSSGLTKFKVGAQTYSNMGPTSGTAGEFSINNHGSIYKVSLASVQGYNGVYFLQCLNGSVNNFSVRPDGTTTIGSAIVTTDILKVQGVTRIAYSPSTPSGPTGYKLYVADGIYTHKLETSSTSKFGDVVTMGTITPTSGYKLYVADGVYTEKITIGTTSTPAGYKLFVADGVYTNKIKATGLSVFDDIVMIGSVSSNSNYKLFVEKGILTEKVKVAVKSTGNWSDYVFNKDYKLMPLSEVESYVRKNKHLPGVPSAEEVVKEGIDLATMDAKLLEKIEEITLYMIEMKKENEKLKQRILLLETK